ncbi:MAG: DUF2341 domain-containing protein [Spirochaetaceae bacterium]
MESQIVENIEMRPKGGRATLFIVLLFFSGLLSQGCTGAGAWDAIREEIRRESGEEQPSEDAVDEPGWVGSVQVTISTASISSYLFDVPVLIRVDPTRVDYDLLTDADYSVGFYLEEYSEAASPLSYECSLWDPRGESLFWVRLPVLTPGDAVRIWMYLGDPGFGTPEDPADVWRNGYVAVLHFDDPEEIYRDSSPFGNHGLNSNEAVEGHTPATSSPGYLGYGIDFDDNTDAIIFPDDPSTDNMRPLHLFAFLNLRSLDGPSRLLSKGDRHLGYQLQGGDSTLRINTRIQHWVPPDADTAGDDPNDVFSEVFVLGYPTDTWRSWNWYWGGEKYDRSSVVYVDDNSYSSGGYEVPDADLEDPGYGAGDIEMDDDSATPLVIGNGDWFGANSRVIDGYLDEVRLSRVSRTPEWIAFQQDLLTETITTFGAFEAE